MIAMDSALVILLAEALFVMIVLVLTVLFVARNRRAREVAEIERFINRLEDEEALKTRLLETILVENCGLDMGAVQVTLKEVTEGERALLQRIIQLFLDRNPGLMGEIDQLIANLSDPFCKLLAENPGAGVVPSASGNADSQEGKKIAGLERINQQLVRQLDTAMKTIDEITGEYTRVFSGNQTALELENSSKKMQQIFHGAEESIRNNMAGLED